MEVAPVHSSLVPVFILRCSWAVDARTRDAKVKGAAYSRGQQRAVWVEAYRGRANCRDSHRHLRGHDTRCGEFAAWPFDGPNNRGRQWRHVWRLHLRAGR
jgi:hypothetical protein